MKNLDVNDLGQVSGGMTQYGPTTQKPGWVGSSNPNVAASVAGAPVTFFCKTCNKTFTTSSGTRYHGICPDCGNKGQQI